MDNGIIGDEHSVSHTTESVNHNMKGTVYYCYMISFNHMEGRYTKLTSDATILSQSSEQKILSPFILPTQQRGPLYLHGQSKTEQLQTLNCWPFQVFLKICHLTLSMLVQKNIPVSYIYQYSSSCQNLHTYK